MLYLLKEIKKDLRMLRKIENIFEKFNVLPSVADFMVRFEKYVEIFNNYIVRIQLSQE